MKLRSVIVLGLALRLAIAPFTAHPTDVFSWYEYGTAVAKNPQLISSFLVPYQYSFFLFVFPATALFDLLPRFSAIDPFSVTSLNPALVQQYTQIATVVPGILFDFLVKLPLILSDTLAAALLYKIALLGGRDVRHATSVAALWFLNPLTIWVSSGWGMFDTLPALFSVLSLYFVVTDKRVLSGSALAIAFVLKYYALALVIPILLLTLSKKRTRAAILTVGSFTILSALLLVPNLSSSFTKVAAVTAPGSPSGLHYSGLSFWTAITLFVPNFGQTLAAEILIACFLVAAYIWIAIILGKSKSVETLSAAFAVPLLVLLLLYSLVGENFFVWVIPFLALLSGDTAVRRSALLLSAIALLSSVTNSLLPYYLLPLAPWIGNYLVSMLGVATPYRAAPAGTIVTGLNVGKIILAGFGVAVAVSILLTITVVVLSENRRAKQYSIDQGSDANL